MPSHFQRYGCLWPEGTADLDVELACIRLGGQWVTSGKTCGAGLYTHYRNACALLWPEDDWHRWVDLSFKTVAENQITVLMGPSDSSKTNSAAKWALLEYWASPDKTLVLVSSTDLRGLELRVWGAIKDLFNRAREKFNLPGNPIDHKHCIANDVIDEGVDENNRTARKLNRGIICIPCLSGGQYTGGLSAYVGIKAPRLRQVSDECQMMSEAHLQTLPNFLGKDYKGIFLGNPRDQLDPLGRISEPVEGWGGHQEPTKTTVWKTKMFNGACVNLVGTDSPNFDYPQDKPPRFPYLINRKKLESVANFWGKDSMEYYSQCIGVLKSGLLSRRVVTLDLCKEHRAFERAQWESTERIKVYGIDAAYSGTGGDRCVGGWIEFGRSIDGETVIRVNPQEVIPVSIKSATKAEDQIAEHVKQTCEAEGIEPENIFYDSTGRGTLGSAFARVFGERAPVPVEFGGKPSQRPVRHDLFIEDDGIKRLKTCREHYYDMVTELWFSVRYIIEANQMREMPLEAAREASQREYGTAGQNKIFIESKHDKKARIRMGRSPDLMDHLAVCVEGARQRGFKIQRLGASLVENEESQEWLQQEAEQYEDALKSQMLTHA